MTLIKICGVKTAEDGFFAAKSSADFVGIVMHVPSKRYVKPSRAQTIAKAIREGGATPVAVFFDEAKDQILDAVANTGITTIQTYSDINLPAHYSMIYANPQKRRGDWSTDYFLFDGPAPGSGEQFRSEHLPNPLPGNFFLAGGIDSANVQTLLQTYQPTGVDVSSGVESNGNKDFSKIQTFIKKVRDHDETIR